MLYSLELGTVIYAYSTQIYLTGKEFRNENFAQYRFHGNFSFQRSTKAEVKSAPFLFFYTLQAIKIGVQPIENIAFLNELEMNYTFIQFSASPTTTTIIITSTNRNIRRSRPSDNSA